MSTGARKTTSDMVLEREARRSGSRLACTLVAGLLALVALAIWEPLSEFQNGVRDSLGRLSTQYPSFALGGMALVAFFWFDLRLLLRIIGGQGITFVLTVILTLLLDIDMKVWSVPNAIALGSVALFWTAGLLLKYRQEISRLQQEPSSTQKIYGGDPLSYIEEDKLGCSFLCEQVATLIGSLPEGSARIAVLGEWGSGKTTFLNMVGNSITVKYGYPVAIIKSWTYNSSQEWRGGFASTVEGTISKYLSLRIGVLSGIPIIGTAARLVGVFLPNLGQAITALFEQRANLVEGKRYASLLIRKALGPKRLVIIIDDLDRARDDIVKEFFWLVRDVMDLPNCIFVCGFDPNAVFKSLGAAEEYGNAYIDKVFQWRFELPRPRPHSIHQLLTCLRESGTLSTRIRWEPLIRLHPLLPENPRQVVSFLRSLCHLHEVFLVRMDDDDVVWELLYLIRLMVAILGESVQSLSEQSDYLSWACMPVLPSDPPDETKVLESAANRLRISDSKHQFIRFSHEIRKVAKLRVSPDQLSYHFRLIRYPEILTWKEYREWCGLSDDLLSQRLLDSRYPLEQRREYLRTAILDIQRQRTRCLESNLESEKNTYRKTELEITARILAVVRNIGESAGLTELFDLPMVIQWIIAFVRRAHKSPELDDVQSTLLRYLASKTPGLASPLLNSQYENVKLRDSLPNDVRWTYEEQLSELIIDAFRNDPDAFPLMLSSPVRRAERLLLSRYNEYIWGEVGWPKLSSELDKPTEIVSYNSLQLLRHLFIAAGAQGESQQDVQELLGRDVIRETLWKAAVGTPPVSLSQDICGLRDRMLKVLGRNDILPI